MSTNAQVLMRYFSIGAVGIVGLTGLVSVAIVYFAQQMSHKIDHPDADESQISTECIENSDCDDPVVLIKLAQAMAGGDESERELSRQLLTRAINEDDQQPLAWALMSFIDSKDAGELSASALSALQTSFDLCRLCDNQELLRWRMEFVLRYWDQMPEDFRVAAAESADILRWRYDDLDFLLDQDAFALRNGIPFGDYLQALASPEIPDLRSP